MLDLSIVLFSVVSAKTEAGSFVALAKKDSEGGSAAGETNL